MVQFLFESPKLLIMIKNIKLIWNFYKTLIWMNLTFSFFMTFYLKTPSSFFQKLFLVYVTTGFLFSLGYFEYFKKKEYYFYFNRSISKPKLYLFAAILNTAIGVFLLITAYHV